MVSRRCPYESDLSESENESPYQNDQNRWDLNELKWIEVNRGEMSDLMEMTWNNPMEVTWVNLMGKSLWFENECPYRFDLIDLSEKVPMFSWMNVPMRVTWNNPMGKSLWSVEGVPIKVTGMNPMRKSLSKWMESMRFEWIEVNRTIRGEMSDLKDLTWNNPMRKSLWSIEGVPIKVTWDEWFDQTLSKWSDLMRNELE